MSKDNKIYAAYGSNMNLRQMKWRCPYAKVLGTGELQGYRLLFRGGMGASVATVEPKRGRSVPVLLWEITPRDEEALDRYEGWPTFYRKETLTVQHDSQPVDAMIYIMNDGHEPGTPSIHYLHSIMQGYIDAGLDIAVLKTAQRTSIGMRRVEHENE
jgi:gamma-glutamylcyclotransferase (GGCT)/AIG2-like uncharacterized protein YtfP